MYNQGGKDMKITIYSTTTCPYCVMLKRWLDDKKVEYTDYLVDKNPYAAQMMMQQGGQGSVPFTVIEHDNGEADRVLGFNRMQFEDILAKA